MYIDAGHSSTGTFQLGNNLAAHLSAHAPGFCRQTEAARRSTEAIMRLGAASGGLQLHPGAVANGGFTTAGLDISSGFAGLHGKHGGCRGGFGGGFTGDFGVTTGGFGVTTGAAAAPGGGLRGSSRARGGAAGDPDYEPASNRCHGVCM